MTTNKKAKCVLKGVASVSIPKACELIWYCNRFDDCTSCDFCDRLICNNHKITKRIKSSNGGRIVVGACDMCIVNDVNAAAAISVSKEVMEALQKIHFGMTKACIS